MDDDDEVELLPLLEELTDGELELPLDFTLPRRVNIFEKSVAGALLPLSEFDFPTKTTPSSIARRLLCRSP